MGCAATPVFATTSDAATPAGVPASGPILSGRIYDATGVALPGARVVVEGTGAQATTNLQGEFSIVTPEAPGDITLLVDYLGRPPVTRVVAAADRGRDISLTLPAASGEAGDIVVTGASLLDNTARALNQQRTADNTVTIISSDAIGRFPTPISPRRSSACPASASSATRARAAISTCAARPANGPPSRSTASRFPRSTRRPARSTWTRCPPTSSPIWR
ncbi:carboxypeptidase-like regulatory domain-containing protein [Sphingomonas sp. I4]